MKNTVIPALAIAALCLTLTGCRRNIGTDTTAATTQPTTHATTAPTHSTTRPTTPSTDPSGETADEGMMPRVRPPKY